MPIHIGNPGLCLFVNHHRDANRGHNGRRCVVLDRFLKVSSLTPQATRRDTPVQCLVCGRVVTRESRQQKFCSARCRKRNAYAENARRDVFSGGLGQYTANGTKPPKNSNGVNGLQAAKSASTFRIYASRHVIQAELFADHDWTRVVSPDGVVCLVASGLRRRQS